jgi:hypothetical protein
VPAATTAKTPRPSTVLRIEAVRLETVHADRRIGIDAMVGSAPYNDANEPPGGRAPIRRAARSMSAGRCP